MSDFKSLNLSAPIHKALDSLGYTTPTPIQMKAIPDVLKGRDIMGIAQTGTGKTAAFALPTLSHIASQDVEPPRKGARALVLAPTRELASQIAVSFKDYGQEMDYLSVAVVYGGVPIHRQIKRLSGGNDVIVATPGRLIDLLERKAVTLKDIEILILDEADQMMDMGFIHALKQIVPLLPKKRQTLFFSATMVPAIKKLAGQFLTDPITISVTPANSTAEKVEQRVTLVNKAEKQDLLGLCLLDPSVERSLVFTRTKHGADRVVKRLRQIGLDSVAIHGNKSQAQRQRALAAFREDRVKILVATDIAARGIDIEGITHVFNFEIPNVPEQYVHRIGRTARANRSGIAHAFVDKEERSYLKAIQKLLKKDIPVVELPEEFLQKARALKTRQALPPPEKEKPETRQGRGKSKKKRARFSRDKANKERGNKAEQGRSENTPNERKEKPFNKENRQGDGEKRGRKKPSWGNDKQNGERRRKAPEKTKGDRNKTDKPKDKSYGTKAESRADRKARNQELHAKQHSRKKPRTGKGRPEERNTAASDGPKAPQKYGKRPQGKKPNHRKGGGNPRQNNRGNRPN